MKKAALVSNYFFSVIMFLLSFEYLFTSYFQNYHGETVGSDWANVPSGFQVLILASFRVMGAGYLACGLGVAYLEYKFIKIKEAWISNAILLLGLTICLGSIYALLIIFINSPGRPPSIPIALATIAIILGFFFNRKYLK